MEATMTEHQTLQLDGCSPTPIAGYLKALGVFRLISEQLDSTTRGFWRDDRFCLQITQGRADIIRFFIEDYSPSPILAPWNGGSGFYPKDRKDAVNALVSSTKPRFSAYRESILAARGVLKSLRITEKVGGAAKIELLRACRARMPDDYLQWIDAALILTNDSASFPPLLGTGGNDGRLEFTRNLMEHLTSLFDPATGEARLPTSLLEAALFDEATDGLSRASVGQFAPGSAGGANEGIGFDGDSIVNPWDFVFMMEGALLFAAAVVNRLGDQGPGALAYPFTVRSSGVGYGSASGSDEGETRGEIWLPLWSRPASLRVIQALLAEGRAELGKRAARNGVDFARAVASLGVDRGIHSFARYGFHVRNGLSYLATPLGRFVVRRHKNIDLLAQIDGWIDRLRRAVGGKNPPSSVVSALRSLDRAVMGYCQRGDKPSLAAVFTALANLEAMLARSFGWCKDKNISPMPRLQQGWLEAVGEDSVEFRLALALASLAAPRGQYPIIENVSPIDLSSRWPRWGRQDSRELVWSDADIEGSLIAMLTRRVMKAKSRADTSYYDDQGLHSARLEDVACFIEGQCDDRQLVAWFRCCLLIDAKALRRYEPVDHQESRSSAPPLSYSLLKLCFAGRPVREVSVPMVPSILRTGSAGMMSRAIELAHRRLRGSGLPPIIDARSHRSVVSPRQARRTLAALVFPVCGAWIEALGRKTLDPKIAANDKAAS